jgi:hypothetical protein
MNFALRQKINEALFVKTASGIDFANSIAQFRVVAKRMIQRLGWCKFITAVVICAPIACGGQILPQLVAHIASLDSDHGISLRETNDGVDLVLTHDAHAVPPHDKAQCVALSAAQPAHIIHFISGPATAKQSASCTLPTERQIAGYFSSVITTEWRTFVPQIPLAYSRPPPDEISVLPAYRSTLLLI